METVPFSLSSSPSPSSLKLTLPRDESNWDESNWDHFAQPSTSAKMLAELALRTTRANIARETQPRPSDKESFISRTKTFLSQRRGKQPQAFGSLRRQVRFMTASKTSRAQHGRGTRSLAIGMFRRGQVDDDPSAERRCMLVSTSSIGCPTLRRSSPIPSFDFLRGLPLFYCE